MSDNNRAGGDVPGNPAQRAGLPENYLPIVWEGFSGLNTRPLRPAIQDEEFAVCDGFMPLGPSNLRTLPGISLPLYFTQGGKSIIWHIGCNLGDTPGHVVLLSDGSVQFVNDVTGGVTQVMPAGTIANPTTILGFTQWNTPVPLLVFAKDQVNGYWLWDGANLFTAGTLSPEINITNPGSNYTSAPAVASQTTGAGTGDVYQAVIENGSVSQINVVSPGSGFAEGDLIALNVSGGGSDQSAEAFVLLSAPTVGGIDQVIVNQGGQGYTGAAQIIAVGGGGTGASFSFTAANGVIESVAVLNPGIGFSSPPIITVNDPGYPGNHIPGGTGFAANCTIAGGQVSLVGIGVPGTGYVTPPTITIIGDGSGAQAVALISGGSVVGTVILNPGSGYTKALALFSGGNNAASATAQLMPFGISGTTLETYNNQIWIGNGSAVATFPPKNRMIASQPGSATGFDPTLGAVVFQSNNAKLRVGYHALVNSNGFLYEIGDSAIDALSGVQTSAQGTQSITTFSNINVDPAIGTPWAASVQLFNRDIVFANPQGIFISYGGSVVKISDALDGFYESGGIFGVAANFSSAVAQIFGRYVYMLLLPIIDQVSKQPTNKLLMWDSKRWWTSSQDTNLTYISTQEVNSQMTAWGTDGENLFQLFTTPSTRFTKTAVSKLWATPGYDSTKMAMHLLGMLNFYVTDQPVNVFIDNETGSNKFVPATIPPGFAWATPGGQTFLWTNGGAPFNWGAAGLVIFGPQPVGQFGRLIGMTVQTTASDVALLSLKLIDQVTSLMP